MNRVEKLQALSRIADLLAEKARTPIAAAQGDVSRTQVRIDAVAAHRTGLSGDAEDPALAALLARQAARLRAVQSGLSGDLAARRATLETAKAAARPAIGRQQVLKTLLDRARADAARQAARRQGSGVRRPDG